MVNDKRVGTITAFPRFSIGRSSQNSLYLWRRGLKISTQEYEASGGHFMIGWTSDVEQVIAGVKISNFGQGGILGR